MSDDDPADDPEEPVPDADDPADPSGDPGPPGDDAAASGDPDPPDGEHADPGESLTDEVDADDPEKMLEEIERKRAPRGVALVALASVGIAFSLFQVWLAARGFTFEVTVPAVGTYRVASLQNLQVRVIHVNFALVMAFLLYPTADGSGALSRRLGRIPPAVEARLGEHPATSAVDRLRALSRWFFLDPDRDRVTPADVTLVLLSLLPTVYYLLYYDEVTTVVRRFGLGGAAPLGDLVPALDPIAVGPLATTPFAYLMGVLGIVLVLEATRRALGMLLVGLVSTFILYGRFGFLIPRGAPGIGLLGTSELRWDQVVQNLWYTVEGILGIPVSVSVRFIYIFILFGAFLEMSGAGKWFIDLAYSATGTRTGGPAKASVISSGFMGMISGSSVANTVTTGALTIPLMKRSGYSSEFSGAVESSVSSGGQILPPVMGAAAFLIVEFLGEPYRTVIIAATLPAIAFFFGMWLMVHLEAAKHGIGGLDRSELLDIGPHLAVGWFYLVPLGLLLYYIVFARLSIGRAGWLTIIATVALIAFVSAYNRRSAPFLGVGIGGLFLGSVAAQFTAGTTLTGLLLGQGGAGLPPLAAVGAALGQLPLAMTLVSVAVLLARPRGDAPLLEMDDAVGRTAGAIDARLGWDVASSRTGAFGTFVVKSLDNGARTATVVVVAVAAAGVIPGIINITGLGGSLRTLILSVSGGSLIVLLILTGVAAVIVGMGMPTTVMYIIIIVLLGPTLPEFGVALLAAHLFVLYLGLMADVTPPVAVAAYAAAGIAKADAFETGRMAFLLSLNKILVPFAFILAPGILLIRVGGAVDDISILSAADVADLGFFLPEVVVPVLGMFAGVYALGPAIIGYYHTHVGSHERVGFTVAALLLSVPGFILLPAGTGLGHLGIEVMLYTSTNDILVRAVGAAVLAVLLVHNRRRATAEGVDAGADPDTVAADA